MQKSKKSVNKNQDESAKENLEKGLTEGEAKGRAEGKIEIATTMLKNHVPIEQICLYTGLSENEINNLTNR